jgi:hypothetical protein
VGVGLRTGEVLTQTFFLPCFTHLKEFLLSFFTTPTLLHVVPALMGAALMAYEEVKIKTPTRA